MAGTAEIQAAEAVAAVRDHPARRLELAARFYQLRPGRKPIGRFGRAKLAFMRWQLERGVLAGPGANRPGSPWRRAVNERLLRDAYEAAQLGGGQCGHGSSSSVEHWLHFLASPSAGSWYRAHNASIIAGCLAGRELAAEELPAERLVIEVALLRVLYAHTLVAAPRLALGRLAPLGRLLGDPRMGMAGVFMSLRRVLPDRYPLTDVLLDRVIRDQHQLGRMLDFSIIGPRLEALYAFSAAELAEPRILRFARDGVPIYTWPYEQRHVWSSDHAPRVTHLLSRLTSPRLPRPSGSGFARPCLEPPAVSWRTA